MAHVVFYEKPGCGGNARQRTILEASGHTLERRNLLTARWTPARLLEFFGPRPVEQWFNRAAPRIKSGEIVPEVLSREEALALLVAEPILIRRPLMERQDGAKLVGFVPSEVESFVGLGAKARERELPSSMDGCAATTKAIADEGVNFGPLPPEIERLLQQGVAAYRRDRNAAGELFRRALALAPEQLPVYYCLYKVHAYAGRLDEALLVAQAGLTEALRQAGWGEDPASWPRVPLASEGPVRFALYTLKAVAFIHLKRDDLPRARRTLDTLAALDPGGLVGWQVVADLAKGIGL